MEKTVRHELIVVSDQDREYEYRLGDGEEATIVFVVPATGALRTSVSVNLEGSRAKASLLGIIIPQAYAEVEVYTRQIHAQPDSVSSSRLRSLVGHDSRVFYQGNIYIAPGASGTDAFQQHDSMLLSAKSRVDTRPVLEILNHEVRCRHGVSIHPMSPDILWYAKTRGLSQEEALRLYADGFLRSLLSNLTDGRFRENVYNQCIRFFHHHA